MCVDVWLFCFYEFAFSQTCLIGFETRIHLFRIWCLHVVLFIMVFVSLHVRSRFFWNMHVFLSWS